MLVDLWTRGMARHITKLEVPGIELGKPPPEFLIWRRFTYPTRYFVYIPVAMAVSYREVEHLQFDTNPPDPLVCELPAHAKIKHEGDE